MAHASAHQKEYARKAKAMEDNRVYLQKMQASTQYQQHIRAENRLTAEQEAKIQKDLEARLALQRKMERETEAQMRKQYKRVIRRVTTNADSEKFAQFQCPSCNDMMMAHPRARIPKLLPCYHTVCAVCLKTLHVHGMLCCPVCRAAVRIESIDQISDDAVMMRNIRVQYVPAPCYPILDVKRTVIAKKLRDRSISYAKLR